MLCEKLERKDSNANLYGKGVKDRFQYVGVFSGDGGRGEFVAECHGDGPA